MMKLIKPFLFIIALLTAVTAKAQVGIGTTNPASAAVLDLNSTTTGFLPPRMTLLQREAIANPVAGLMVYCNDCGSKGQLQYYDGADWIGMVGGVLALAANSQLGNDIDGEAADDQSGWSVALSADGSRLAIDAHLNDGNGTNSGHVRLYNWSGTTWVQLGNDIDGEAINDRSGYAVSLSGDGNLVAIGARLNNNGNGTDAGHVRIYSWNGTAWVQQGADIDGESTASQSGYSVSLSPDGNSLAIGASYNSELYAKAGQVRIYNWNGTAWVQLGLDIDGEAAQDFSGWSVSLSADGTRVAIGAPNNDGTGLDAGHVRIYDWSGTAWVQLGLDIDGEAAGDKSGYSVSLSADGSRVAIGAPYNGNPGQVSIYNWSGTDWVQLGLDIKGEGSGDRSGYSISLSGDGSKLAIGAPNNYNQGILQAGHVRVYGWNGSSWYRLSVDIDAESNDLNGAAVSISADGKRVAIGAYLNDGNGVDAGHVRVYDFQ